MRHPSSCFFDLSALDADDDDGDDDEENLDEGDLATDGLAEAPEVLPGGRVSFASRLEDICHQYEGGPGTAGHDVSHNPLCHSRPNTAGHGGPSSPLRHSQPDVTSDPFTWVYKIDILIGIYSRTSLFHDLNVFVDSAVNDIWVELNRKPFKIIPGFHRSLYIEASSPKAIITSIPPSHQDIVRNIILVPTEDVLSLYSTHEVFASAFWVRVKRGAYNNDVGYVLLQDGDKIDVLLAPREHPYNSDRCKLLFDIDAAHRAGYIVMVTKPSDGQAGVVTCRGLVYQQGLILWLFTKLSLEVVEAPHPDDLAFHYLAGVTTGSPCQSGWRTEGVRRSKRS